MSNKGLDIGTNMLVSSYINKEDNKVVKMQRDAFYQIIPKSEVNRNSIKISLEKREANFITEGDTFIIVGEDALEIAIERNDVAKRPLKKGIISPKEKDSLPMLKLIIESLIGKGNEGDKVVFSCPASPIDTHFDIIYHTEIMKTYINELGYIAMPINEGFAIGLSELLDDCLTGICISYGAGMVNICVLHQGDPLVEFSMTRSGDYIDTAVGNALDMSPSLVQLEKEAGIDLFNPSSKIMEAVSVYYNSVINYTLNNIVYELNKRKRDLPIFREPVPVIVSGGLALAKGFVKKFSMCLNNTDFPIKVKEIRLAENPMTCVSNGCMLASNL